jgi:hypothetical protein
VSDLQQRIAEYHHLRFPTAGPEHVALKAAEEVGEVCSAVNGMVSKGDFGKGDVVGEAADCVLVLLALVGRWFDGRNLLAEVEARLARNMDPNGGHRSCLKADAPFDCRPQEAVDAEHWADWQAQQ